MPNKTRWGAVVLCVVSCSASTHAAPELQIRRGRLAICASSEDEAERARRLTERVRSVAIEAQTAPCRRGRDRWRLELLPTSDHIDLVIIARARRVARSVPWTIESHRVFAEIERQNRGADLALLIEGLLAELRSPQIKTPLRAKARAPSRTVALERSSTSSSTSAQLRVDPPARDVQEPRQPVRRPIRAVDSPTLSTTSLSIETNSDSLALGAWGGWTTRASGGAAQVGAVLRWNIWTLRAGVAPTHSEQVGEQEVMVRAFSTALGVDVTLLRSAGFVFDVGASTWVHVEDFTYDAAPVGPADVSSTIEETSVSAEGRVGARLALRLTRSLELGVRGEGGFRPISPTLGARDEAFSPFAGHLGLDLSWLGIGG